MKRYGGCGTHNMCHDDVRWIVYPKDSRHGMDDIG